MHAGTEDLIGFRDVRIRKLREREAGLHDPMRQIIFLSSVNAAVADVCRASHTPISGLAEIGG
jgi:hypothetical protein